MHEKVEVVSVEELKTVLTGGERVRGREKEKKKSMFR